MTAPCLILAAGFGTRMGALTANRPKPLIEVGGQSLLDHALGFAREAACPKIAVNAHYRADQIEGHLTGAEDVHVLIEAPNILDSGGAVKNAANTLGLDAMLTLNADNVWRGPNPLTALSTAFDPGRMGAFLLLSPREKVVGRKEGGDFNMDADGRLTLDKANGDYVYLGAQMLDPRPCATDPRDVFSLRDVWARLEDQGRLFGLVYEGQWADVGHPEGIALAEAMLEAPHV
ncbi:nucleotidyltransferase family protein [Gymnodinialimonas hymeniacidonis]|uniref:nucleotidyltransferase family protein n=1 Tax=Gymnodinialimonas hymeniacidonis TaxID=3126508 RepID=UPI0034C61FDB